VQLSKNVGKGLTYVLIVVAIVVGAQLLVGSALGSSPVYVVVSGSMIPTLEIGDLVITQSVQFSSIHVGQVIIYVRPDSLGGCQGETIVHRVVGVTSQGLITQGDDRKTNPLPDEPYEWPPVPAACVKGVVVLAVPYLGLVSMLIPYPWNYVLVGLILIFVFLSELRPSGEKETEENNQGSGATGAPSEIGPAPLEAPSPSPGTSRTS
jgi:signal peptidase I